MADDVSITAGSGTVVRTDELAGGQHVQYLKLMNGVANAEDVIPGDATYGLDVDVTRFGRSFSKVNSTGSGVISASALASGDQRLVSVMLHSGSAPTSAGNLTVTLNANAGSAYDTLLASENMVGVTNYVFLPDYDIFLENGDAVDISYTNPDNATYGLQITLEAV